MVDLSFIADYFSGNSQSDYLTALGIFVGLFIFLKLFDYYFLYGLQKLTRKTKVTFDDVVIDFFKGIKWPFYAFVSFYIATRFLVIPDLIDDLLRYLLIIVIVYYAACGLVKIVDHLFEIYTKKKKDEDSLESESMIKVFKFIVKIIIWSIALLMALSNFGINITPMIASLGVGGIAIALALQSVLGDLFSAFAIYFDKPFKEGDFVIVGDDMGVIKFIGIKSTRIEALGGQEIVVSNSDLVNSRINNYKKMEKRRIVFGFGVVYGTSSAKLKKVNKIVKEVIDKLPDAELDRVHFKEFGDWSLNFEVVYYTNTSDYNKYMDIQQEINFGIKEKFEKAKIEMAFPTRTLYVNKS